MYQHRGTYGKNTTFTIIDEINSTKSKDWKSLECYWIEQFRQWGFKTINKNEGGGGPSFKEKHSIDLVVNKISKPILQFDKNFKIIKEWSSIEEAKEKTKIKSISSCLRGINKESGGFIWKYKNDEIKDFSFNTSPTKGKKIYQFDKDGKFIKSYISAQEAEKIYNDKKSRDNIGACCRKQQKSAYGYIWSYDNMLDLDFYLNKNEKPTNFGIHKYKKIAQHNLDGTFIKEWNSIKEASHSLDISVDLISHCCRNKQKQTNNFKFKYLTTNKQ
jgi:hypothetical protein